MEKKEAYRREPYSREEKWDCRKWKKINRTKSSVNTKKEIKRRSEKSIKQDYTGTEICRRLCSVRWRIWNHFWICAIQDEKAYQR
jgi:hypothetical protein